MFKSEHSGITVIFCGLKSVLPVFELAPGNQYEKGKTKRAGGIKGDDVMSLNNLT